MNLFKGNFLLGISKSDWKDRFPRKNFFLLSLTSRFSFRRAAFPRPTPGRFAPSGGGQATGKIASSEDFLRGSAFSEASSAIGVSRVLFLFAEMKSG
ncbi:MAG: hypothetical protein ACI4P3_01130 [Candidatus Spyradosoma sp.]